ncbi:MAG: hypothetical protein ABSF77_17900 [Spirochaetia bacterium]|jgi:vacuolar-type H+-ATPase subunit H
MSDMLEKLLGVEKNAAGLVSEAEAEANRRTTQARAEMQKKQAEILKQKALDAEKDVEAERKRLAEERKRKNEEYRESLLRRPVDRAAFTRAALSFIEKGRA